MDIKQLYKLYEKHPLVTTDSRNCPKGSIFIALKGASFDGNQFAQAALEKGCSYAIVDEPEYYKENDPRYILTADCLITYKELAREHRRQFHIPVIGITGTNGKTTTKELLSAVLSEKYNVLHTEGNFNNDVGVPKTLLRIEKQHDIAVIEMGASHPGDIKALVDYVEPTCGLITNVGMAHLQGFGSFEGVKQTKGELYDYLEAHQGLLFLDAGNPHLTGMASKRKFAAIERYAADKAVEAEVKGELGACAPFLKFTWSGNCSAPQEIQTHLIGTYNLSNMLAAISVGLHFGVTPEQIKHALENYVPSNNRSQLIVTDHNKLIVDAYNANPTSMLAALKNFVLMQVDRKIAILGDMRELGEASREEHQKIVDYLRSTPLKQVWLVGEEFAKTNCDFRKFKDVASVKEAIAAKPFTDHYILIKGSNGIQLFQLPECL